MMPAAWEIKGSSLVNELRSFKAERVGSIAAIARSVVSGIGSDNGRSMGSAAAGQSGSVRCWKGHIKLAPTDKMVVAGVDLCVVVSSKIEDLDNVFQLVSKDDGGTIRRVRMWRWRLLVYPWALAVT
jgi:hypothetical protein